MFKHQGDITFIPIKGKLAGEKEKHNGSYIVGYGEATGHHHTVTVARPQDLEIVKVAGGYVFQIKSEAIVTHQEHKEIRLVPGTYRVGHEREIDYFADAIVRNVVD